MGNLYLYQGRYNEARSHYEQSLRLFQRIGDRQGEAQILNNLGAIHFHVGDFTPARSYYERALTIEQEIGGMHGVSLTSGNLSLLLQHQGDFGGGLSYGLRGQNHRAGIWAPATMRHLRSLCIGHAQTGLEHWDDAHQAYRQSLLLRQELGQENQALEPQAGLIRVALAAGMADVVLSDVEEILAKLQDNSLLGIVEPFRIYWTCYLALRTNNSDRAGKPARAGIHAIAATHRVDHEHAATPHLHQQLAVRDAPSWRSICDEAGGQG